MATQTIEFRAAPSQTVTLRLFVVGSDTQVASAAATEATNRKGTYAAAFTDVAAGEYQYVATIGTTTIIPLSSGYVTLALATATYQVYDAAKAVIVNDKTGYSLATAPPTAGAVADASQATLLLVKAKTDLITSQTANQQQTPVNQMVIIRGDSYSGATRKTHAVTTDYTGYTATFTIRHRVTDAVLLTCAGAVDSSTQLSVALTTANTAFALLVDPTEFGPHPYDFRLVSGSIEKTESGIAIVRRDVTRA